MLAAASSSTTASSPIGFFKWTSKGFYYIKDSRTNLLFSPNGGNWQTFALPAAASSAGSVGPDGNLSMRDYGNQNLTIWDTTTNTVKKHWIQNPVTNVGENSRFGTLISNQFLVKDFSASIKSMDITTGIVTDTGITPATSHPSSDSGNGLLFIGGYAGIVKFQAYNPTTNTIANLADSPNVSNHSTLVFVASPK